MAQYSQYHWFNPKWPGGLSGVFGLNEKIFISHSTCKIIFGVEKTVIYESNPKVPLNVTMMN